MYPLGRRSCSFLAFLGRGGTGFSLCRRWIRRRLFGLGNSFDLNGAEVGLCAYGNEAAGCSEVERTLVATRDVTDHELGCVEVDLGNEGRCDEGGGLRGFFSK